MVSTVEREFDPKMLDSGSNPETQTDQTASRDDQNPDEPESRLSTEEASPEHTCKPEAEKEYVDPDSEQPDPDRILAGSLSKLSVNECDNKDSDDGETLPPNKTEQNDEKESFIRDDLQDSSTPAAAPADGSSMAAAAVMPTGSSPILPSNHHHQPPSQKSYDYLLKVLLVGDSDVGKQEIISNLEDGINDSPFCSSEGAAYKTTIILIDGKRVKLQLWDTSGQGRFCTIIRSYSRGAQGILLVYDITNKWSFEGISRWLHEVDHYAPGIPKVLVGNRLHLAFNRQVRQEEAEEYAERNSMGFIEVSPLVNFNISETFAELARMALKRNGMERLYKSNKVSSLYELCAISIVNTTTVYDIDRLPLPSSVKQNLKSYSVTNYSISQANKKYLRRPGSVQRSKSHKRTFSNDSNNLIKSALTPSALLRRRCRRHLANTPADAANVSCGPGNKSCILS